MKINPSWANGFIDKNKKILIISVIGLLVVVASMTISALSQQVRNRDKQIAKISRELEIVWSDYEDARYNLSLSDEGNADRIKQLEEQLDNAMLGYNQFLARLKAEYPDEYMYEYFKGAGEKWDCLAAQTPQYSDSSKCPE